MSKQHSTLLPKTATMSNEFIVKFRFFSTKSNVASTLLPVSATMSNEISLSTKSKQIEHAQFLSTLSKGRNFVRHCCQKRQQCRSNVRLCRQNCSTCSIRQCCFDIIFVAAMDGFTLHGVLSAAHNKSSGYGRVANSRTSWRHCRQGKVTHFAPFLSSSSISYCIVCLKIIFFLQILKPQISKPRILLDRITAITRYSLLLQRSSVVCLFVCVCVCWSRLWALQKRLNRSRCRLDVELWWTQGTMY